LPKVFSQIAAMAEPFQLERAHSDYSAFEIRQALRERG
jgi:hypothetical protein